MNKSLDIIHEEHRALAAMLSGMRTLVAGIEAGRIKPDFDLLASMIRWIASRTAASDSSNSAAHTSESRSTPSISWVRSFDPIDTPSTPIAAYSGMR